MQIFEKATKRQGLNWALLRFQESPNMHDFSFFFVKFFIDLSWIEKWKCPKSFFCFFLGEPATCFTTTEMSSKQAEYVTDYCAAADSYYPAIDSLDAAEDELETVENLTKNAPFFFLLAGKKVFCHH